MITDDSNMLFDVNTFSLFYEGRRDSPCVKHDHDYKFLDHAYDHYIWASVDNIITIAFKTLFAIENNYDGAFLYDMSYDSPNNDLFNTMQKVAQDSAVDENAIDVEINSTNYILYGSPLSKEPENNFNISSALKSVINCDNPNTLDGAGNTWDGMTPGLELTNPPFCYDQDAELARDSNMIPVRKGQGKNKRSALGRGFLSHATRPKKRMQTVLQNSLTYSEGKPIYGTI